LRTAAKVEDLQTDDCVPIIHPLRCILRSLIRKCSQPPSEIWLISCPSPASGKVARELRLADFRGMKMLPDSRSANFNSRENLQWNSQKSDLCIPSASPSSSAGSDFTLLTASCWICWTCSHDQSLFVLVESAYKSGHIEAEPLYPF